MTISLPGYATLSLLALVPLSGYDLAREMKNTALLLLRPGAVGQVG